MSCAEGLAEVRAARERGLQLTAETCPHYLAFAEEDFERVGPALKCAPPIRDADFALVDPERSWTFDAGHLQTRSGISPYLGRAFRGAVVRTIVRGRTVFADGEVAREPGWGRLVRPARVAH